MNNKKRLSTRSMGRRSTKSTDPLRAFGAANRSCSRTDGVICRFVDSVLRRAAMPLVVVLVVATLGLIGCDSPPAANSPDSPIRNTSAKSGIDLRKSPAGSPYRIVTTVGMVTDIVQSVAGEHAEVIGLLGPGVDPHLYKPTRNDVKRLSEADVIFYSGLMLEGRMADVFARVQRAGTPAFPVTEGLDESQLMEPPGFDGHWDPHVWMDVSLWSHCVDYVAQQLAEYDPSHAEDYKRNAAAYRGQLDELDQYVRRVIGSVPDSQRVLVTAHDAFGYFERAYGMPVHSVQGISTESDASVDDVNQLVELVVSRKIPAIFVETSVSERNIRAIIEGAGSRGWQVSIGGSLYSDAMGSFGSYEGTYIGMIDRNATTIARALGGEAPAGGFQGKLESESKLESARNHPSAAAPTFPTHTVPERRDALAARNPS